MYVVNRLMNFLGDVFFHRWSSASPWPALIAGSVVVAALLVALFHFSSNQFALRRSRNRFIARTLELLLFRHDARVSLSACWRIVVGNFAYLASFARPMVVALVPMIFIFSQFAAWFEYRPVRVAESVIVEVELDKSYSILDTPVSLELSDSLEQEGIGVRIPETNEICWRIRAKKLGDAWIDVRSGDVTARKSLQIGGTFAKISPRRIKHNLWQELLYPVESPLPADSLIDRIDIRYPSQELLIGDSEVHWLVASLILMMGGGLAFGKLFGVNIA